jgi:hypothetical protein
MQRRTLDDWKNLVDKQIASGFTIIDCCSEHQLATSCFYVFRKKLSITSGSYITSIMSYIELNNLYI